MKNSQVKIAIIDSGLEKDNPNIDYQRISYGWTAFENDFGDKTGHGTNIVKIIQEKFLDAVIVILKVFDNKLRTKDLYIIEAINWCIENKIKIINLSIAISEFKNYFAIKQICDSAYAKGVIIIASAENTGKPCIPAYWDTVIGVGGVRCDEELLYTDSAKIQFYSRMKHNNFSSIVGAENVWGTSYAAAYVSGMLCGYVNNDTTLTQAKRFLIDNSKKVLENSIINNINFDFYKNTKKVYVENNWNMCSFGNDLLVKSSQLEKFLFSQFKHRIKHLEGHIRYKDLQQMKEEDFIPNKDFLEDLHVSHIFRNNNPVIVILNISNYAHLPLLLINIFSEYAKRNGDKIKSIVTGNEGVYFEDVEYSYQNSICELNEEKKYLLIKSLIDSIGNKYGDINAIFMEIEGKVVDNVFKLQTITNQIIMLAANPVATIVVGEDIDMIEASVSLIEKICPNIILKKFFVNYTMLCSYTNIKTVTGANAIRLPDSYFTLYNLKQLYRDLEKLFLK